jgi:hypothetical protein
MDSLGQGVYALFELVNLELDPLQAFMLLDLPPIRQREAGWWRCVRSATGKKATFNDVDAGLAGSDSYLASFLLPGVSGLARCLPFGDELPASRVTKNSPFRILVHFIFLSF